MPTTDVSMPPPPPPQGAPPPPAGLAAEEKEILSAMPHPSAPYKASVVKGLVDEFNRTFDAIAGTDVPDVPMPEVVDGHVSELPGNLVVPIFMLSRMLVQMGMDQYRIDPALFKDDTGVRMVAGTLKKIGDDKAVKKALEAEGAKEKEAAEPPMEEKAAMDGRLQAGM